MSNDIKDYRDLLVWQKSMLLVKLIYQITQQFPKEEMYGLISQIRRCAISIPSNIAEGSRRSSRKEYRNFVLISYGSSSELETQLEIAKMPAYLSENYFQNAQDRLHEVGKMLHSLQNSLKE